MKPSLELIRRLDRAARIGLLGIADLETRKPRPRNRPRTVDTPLRRDEIAQTVLYLHALHPTAKLESIVEQVRMACRVSRSYVFNALGKLDPERRKNIESSARAFAEAYPAGERLP